MGTDGAPLTALDVVVAITAAIFGIVALAELVRERACGCGPVLRQLGEAAQHDRIEIRRERPLAAARGWLRLAVQVMATDLHQAVGFEHVLTRQQIVSHAAHRIEIAARVDGVGGLDGFGSHVVRRA